MRVIEEVGQHRLFATFTDDIPTVTTAISNLPLLFTQFAIVAGCLIYLGWLSLPLLAFVVVYMIVGIVTHQLPLSKSMHYFRLLREEWDAMLKSLRGLTEGTKELKLHRPRRQEFISDQLEPTMDSIRRYSRRANTLAFAAGHWGMILFFIFIGAILFGAPRFLNVDRPTLTGYTLAILYMNSPLALIINTLPNLGRALIAFQKIKALGLSLASQPLENDAIQPSSQPVSWNRLELISVTHNYQQETGLNDFTLGPLDILFRPGEIVFLMGGNGSGKTTLAKLLAGLYTPENGEICLDGKPITEPNRDDYRQHFSAIFSDFHLFEKLLGLNPENLDDKVRNYLIQLQLSHKVEIKERAFSTIDLSQGQRKRLALLTAYLEDRSLYIFDEWAADQDPLFKRVFYYQLLPELKARGKTLIVISHDDRFFHLADRIIKLESGQLEYDKRVVASTNAPAEISASAW